MIGQASNQWPRPPLAYLPASACECVAFLDWTCDRRACVVSPGIPSVWLGAVCAARRVLVSSDGRAAWRRLDHGDLRGWRLADTNRVGTSAFISGLTSHHAAARNDPESTNRDHRHVERRRRTHRSTGRGAKCKINKGARGPSSRQRERARASRISASSRRRQRRIHVDHAGWAARIRARASG